MLERRVLLVSGPRECGKTTLARELESNETEYRTFDDGTLREAAENDPQGFIKRSAKTLIVDEVQRIPSLFSAIKKAVDEDSCPGQYLLTGSTNIRSLPTLVNLSPEESPKSDYAHSPEGKSKGPLPGLLIPHLSNRSLATTPTMTAMPS